MDETLWHKCDILFPRRTIEGKLTWGTGQIWQRRINGKWEYRQDEETDDEWMYRNSF